MLQNNELVEQIREMMANSFDVEENELPEQISQETYSKWTSLSHVILIASLEETYNVTFTMDQIQHMTTLPKVIDILKQTKKGL